MAWNRNDKGYGVEYIGPASNKPAMMVAQCWEGQTTFYDFKSQKFLDITGKQTDPTYQWTQVLPILMVPSFPGPLQRFHFVLDTSAFDDGDYNVYQVDYNGALTGAPESFSIFQGSAVGIIPNPLLGTT